MQPPSATPLGRLNRATVVWFEHIEVAINICNYRLRGLNLDRGRCFMIFRILTKQHP